MPFDVTAALQILPQFIAAGIIAFIFYSEFKKPWKVKPKFFLVRENDPAVRGDLPTDGVRYTTDYESEHKSRGLLETQLGNVHLFFLTVNLWILLAFILIPLSNLGRVMPTFNYPTGTIVYIILAVLFLTALVSTVISRITMTKTKLVALLASGGVGAYLAFYLPFMQFVMDYTSILRWVFIYCTVAVSLFGIYTLSSMLQKRQTTNMAVIGSYAAYAMTAALLAFNLFQNAF